MNFLSQVANAQFPRRLVPSFVFFIFAMLLAFKVSGYIVSNDLVSLAFVGLIVAGSAIVAVMVNDWRKGLYAFLAWLLFEDFARKFLGNNMAIYFAKDFLMVVVYLSFFASWRRKDQHLKTFRPPFLVALLAIVWFGALQVFNPASTTIFYGLMGMKLYFCYIPLLLIGYALIDSETALRRFFFITLSLVLVIVALGIAQAIIGPRFLSPAILADDIRTLSEAYREAPISHVMVYRPTSVFVSTGRFGNLLVVSWLLVFGFSGYVLLRHRTGRTFAFVALGLTAAGCLMCSSRGVFMWSLGGAILGGVAFIWGAPWRQGEVLRIVRALPRAALGVGLAVSILLLAYPEAFLNRVAVYSETLDPRSPASELAHRARDYPLANFLGAFGYDRWPYGYGIGTASLGGQYVARFFHAVPPETPVESGYGNLVLEMGIGGLILWITMSFAVVRSAWKVVKKLKGSPFFPLGFMIFLYSFILLFPMTFTGIQSYQDFILNSYLWLLLGILFRLPTLALSAQFSTAGSASQTGSSWTR